MSIVNDVQNEIVIQNDENKSHTNSHGQVINEMNSFTILFIQVCILNDIDFYSLYDKDYKKTMHNSKTNKMEEFTSSQLQSYISIYVIDSLRQNNIENNTYKLAMFIDENTLEKKCICIYHDKAGKYLNDNQPDVVVGKVGQIFSSLTSDYLNDAFKTAKYIIDNGKRPAETLHC